MLQSMPVRLVVLDEVDTFAANLGADEICQTSRGVLVDLIAQPAKPTVSEPQPETPFSPKSND